MNGGHYLSTREIEGFFQHKPERLCELAFELRNMVARLAPEATERIVAGKGLSYHHAKRGGPVRAGICGIEIHEDHVRLAFVHGAFLPDPEKLLRGDRIAKRFLEIRTFNEARWDAYEELIRCSTEFDPASIQT
jgi:hypothetical protein